MKLSYTTLESWAPRILSVLRIVTALLYLQSGLVKFFGFPVAGPPLAGLIIIAAILETFGSLLVLVGLFTRPVAFIRRPDVNRLHATNTSVQAIWRVGLRGSLK
jgi:putative oxidoreductase